MRRLHDPERGASFTEYAVVYLLVASIAVAVVGAGFATQISDLVSRTIGCAMIPASCDDGPDNPPAASGGTDEETENASPYDDEEILRYNARGEDEAPRRSYECGMWQLVCDWGQGAASEAADIVSETAEGARGTACLARLFCDDDEFRSTWGGVRDSATQWFTDPLGAAEDAANDWADGPLEDYNNGYEDRSSARSIVLAGASFFGFGFTRGLPNIPDIGSGSLHRRNAEEAADNGNASAAERHADNAEEAAEDSETAARANPDDHDLQEQAREDRDDADAAARAVPVARAREDLISTETGRELNRILGENDVEIRFEDLQGSNYGHYSPGDNSITIDISLANSPAAAAVLAHEASHARNSSGLPTHQEVGRQEYMDAYLRDEGEARVAGFQVAQELREQGNDVPMIGQEEVYRDYYSRALNRYDHLSDEEAYRRAGEDALEEFTEYIADAPNSNGTTYREQFGVEWDWLTNSD